MFNPLEQKELQGQWDSVMSQRKPPWDKGFPPAPHLGSTTSKDPEASRILKTVWKFHVWRLNNRYILNGNCIPKELKNIRKSLIMDVATILFSSWGQMGSSRASRREWCYLPMLRGWKSWPRNLSSSSNAPVLPWASWKWRRSLTELLVFESLTASSRAQERSRGQGLSGADGTGRLGGNIYKHTAIF